MRRDRVLTFPFALAVASTFGVFLTVGMLLPVLPLFAKGPLASGELGVGIAVGASSPTALLFQPLAGWLGDRRGRRVLVVSGPLLMAVTIAATTWADSLAALVALRLGTGIGEALAFCGVATVVNDLAPPGRRGETISLYSLGVWSGLALGPLLGEAVLGDPHRFDAVWLVAASSALAAAVLGLALPETRPAPDPTRTRSRLVHPAAIAPGIVLVASAFGFAGFNAFVALHARELGLGGAGVAFLLYAGVVLAIRVLGRELPDRLGSHRSARLALALSGVGLLAIGLWSAPTGLYLGTAIFACGTALTFPSLMALAVGRAHEGERGAVVGTFGAFAEVGFALGALSLGAIAAIAGYDGVFLAGAATAFGGLALLSCLPALPLRSTTP